MSTTVLIILVVALLYVLYKKKKVTLPRIIYIYTNLAEYFDKNKQQIFVVVDKKIKSLSK